MRGIFLSLVLSAALLQAFAQKPHASLLSYSAPDKILIAKSSMDIPSWHEKSFWSLYEKYLKSSESLISVHHRTLENIAALPGDINSKDAALLGEQAFAAARDVLNIQKKYYKEMGV